MSRISGKIALTASALAVIASIAVVFLTPDNAFVSVAVTTVIVGTGVYFLSDRLVARRLSRVTRLVDSISEADSFAPLPESAGDEIDHLNQHVSIVAVSVRDNVTALRKIESYRRDFLGDISHELKTPIFAVRGFAETLIDGAMDDPDVQISFLEKIIQNADRLGALAEDLNAITRIETGELRMEMVHFDLGSVIKDVAEQLEPMSRSGNIQLNYRVEKNLKQVYGDKERIHQVIRNLAENAIKYTLSGGRTEIVARSLDERHVRVSVVDNGIGISQEHIDRLTERFFRVDRSRSRGLGGSGLGLSIVKHVLAAHNQRLKIESTPGKGSTFAFDLRFAESPTSRISNPAI